MRHYNNIIRDIVRNNLTFFNMNVSKEELERRIGEKILTECLLMGNFSCMEEDEDDSSIFNDTTESGDVLDSVIS